MTPEQLAFRAAAEPAPAHWGGTGALLIPDDGRDYPPEAHPRVREVLAVGAPNEFDRSAGVCEILDQGPTGACVVFSTCTGIQADNNLDRGICYHFDAAAMYREMGGTGSNGIDSRAELQACVDKGAPLREGGRVKIGSYFRCDQTPELFVEQIKAAVAAGMVVVIALLLPSTWGGVWREGTPTAGYHQLLVLGFKDRLFWGPNTWSANWPGGSGPHPPGFYECSFDYVVGQNFLQQHTYAFFFDPFEVHGPTPTPTPIPVPVPVPTPTPQPAFVGISGKVSGANLSSVVVSDGYTLQGQGLTWPLTVTQVNGPLPNPIPDPLPIPTPTPDPGQISVKLNPAGIWLEVRLSDPATGSQLAGMVTATLNGAPYPVARPRTTPGVAALLRRPVAGAIITGKADDDRKGTATV